MGIVEMLNGIVDSRFLGLDDDEFLRWRPRRSFTGWSRLHVRTTQIENNQGIIRYKLWWGKEIESAVGIQTEACPLVEEPFRLVRTEHLSLHLVRNLSHRQDSHPSLREDREDPHL